MFKRDSICVLWINGAASARPGLWRAAVACCLLLSGEGMAQTAVPAPTPAVTQTATQPAAAAKTQGTIAGDAGAVELDRVVAIVNGDLILESDVDEERRFAVFQPYSEPTGSFSRDQAIQRLIDRTLILQQAKQQTKKPISDAEVEANLADLRKDILACKEYRCNTPEGWRKFLKDNGFSEEEISRHWRERMETLQFIEDRFRMGIRLSDDQVKDYYTKTLLPKYAERKATPPKFDSISDRIREILLQEQVSKLLEDWLKALRASGDVRMVAVDEVTR